MTDPQPRVGTGLAIAGVGFVLSAAFFVRPDLLSAPAWVAHLAATAFVMAGAIVALRAKGRSRAADAAVCALLACLAGIGLWAALGEDAGQCTSGYGGVAFQSSEAACRVAFGIGSLLVMGMLLLALRPLVKSRAAG